MGKIYSILVPFSISPLKCMVKNNFKNVFAPEDIYNGV
jgi:hypothetical protein